MDILRLKRKVNTDYDLLFACCFCTALWTVVYEEASLVEAYKVFGKSIYSMKCPCCGEYCYTVDEKYRDEWFKNRVGHNDGDCINY